MSRNLAAHLDGIAFSDGLDDELVDHYLRAPCRRLRFPVPIVRTTDPIYSNSSNPA